MPTVRKIEKPAGWDLLDRDDAPPIQLLDTEDAAIYCGLSASGLKHHIRAGHVTPIYAKKKITIFLRDELDRFMDEPRDPRGAPRKR